MSPPPRAGLGATSPPPPPLNLNLRVAAIAATLELDPSLPLKALVDAAMTTLVGMRGTAPLADQITEIEKMLG